MKIDLKTALLLAAICFIGGLFLVPYQLNSMKILLPEQYELTIDSISVPFPFLVLLSALQLMVVAFVFAYIGVKLSRKAGLSIPILHAIFKKDEIRIEKFGVILAILFGVITSFILTVADRFYYQYEIEVIGQNEPQFSIIGLLAGVFYGGVFEEVLMRLFFMSLFVWILMKLFRKSSSKLNKELYWIAIIVAATLFAAGHLPATELLFGELNTTIIIRCFLLNGIGGIFFGYLYWKKGIEYAILSHMFTHITTQLLFIPIFY